MAENQESPSIIESLAVVTDAMQTIFPEGKMICVYELPEEEFKKVQTNFRKIDSQYNRFSIDISGLEHVFILENTNIPIAETPKQNPPKKTIKQKLVSWFKSSGGTI